MPVTLHRRDALKFALAAPFIFSARAHASSKRIAAIDLGMIETALALSVTPVAATELKQFRKIAIEPTVPQNVVNIGLRGTPNLELLRVVNAELILISSFYEYQRKSLERIAPVLSLPVCEQGQPPYALAQYSTIELGKTLSIQSAAQAYVAQAEQETVTLESELTKLSARPAYAISLGDSRHFRAFGADSMCGDVLVRFGLINAWTDKTSYSAAAPVGIEALAQNPDALIIVVGPVPPEVQRSLADNAIWNALPAVRNGD